MQTACIGSLLQACEDMCRAPQLLSIPSRHSSGRGNSCETCSTLAGATILLAASPGGYLVGNAACDIFKGLRALAKRCCQHKTATFSSSQSVPSQPQSPGPQVEVDQVNLALTPLTLALAVVSAASRVTGIIGAHPQDESGAHAIHSA